MIISLLHNHYSPEHLEEVKAEMIKRGAPRIRAIWNEGCGEWKAVEGCHRIRAAHALGLTPIIVDITNQERVRVQDDGESVRKGVKRLAQELEDNWQAVGFTF
jgi:hypothetical protein